MGHLLKFPYHIRNNESTPFKTGHKNKFIFKAPIKKNSKNVIEFKAIIGSSTEQNAIAHIPKSICAYILCW